jgi:hypothetical protein
MLPYIPLKQYHLKSISVFYVLLLKKCQQNYVIILYTLTGNYAYRNTRYVFIIK